MTQFMHFGRKLLIFLTSNKMNERSDSKMATTTTTTTDEVVVGVIFPAKKIDHLRNVLHEVKDGVRFVLIDLYDASVTSAESITEKYGKFDAILHKLAHEMVFSRLGDAGAAQRLDLMQQYVQRHPDVKVIDPITSVQLLTDRHAACEMLMGLQHQEKKREEEEESAGSEDAVAFCVPKFHVIETREQFDALCRQVDAGEAKLPLICKSVEACGAWIASECNIVRWLYGVSE